MTTTSAAESFPIGPKGHQGKIPSTGLGTADSDKAPEKLEAAVHHALELGYRHFDTAWAYENSEAAIGRVLHQWLTGAHPKLQRDQLFITSKLWMTWMKPDRVESAIRESLSRLQLDHLDLYLIHWPIPMKIPANGNEVFPDKWEQDKSVKVKDTWAAMESLVSKGLTKYIGLSNFTVPQIKQILEVAKIHPSALQVEMHPFLPQPDLLDFCKAHHIQVIAYSPLGSPAVPEKFRPPGVKSPMEYEVIKQLATKHHATPAQILLSWARQRGVTVIPKSTNLERIRTNFTPVALDPTDMDAVTNLGLHHPIRLVDPKGFMGVDVFGGQFTL